MSTRAQLRFVDGDSAAQVYQHSDGYPDGVVRSLQALREFLEASRGYVDGPSYTAANFVLVGKLSLLRMVTEGETADGRDISAFGDDVEVRGDDGYRAPREGELEGATWTFGKEEIPIETPFDLFEPAVLGSSMWSALGYGIEPVGRWHGDEEYLYVVDMSGSEWSIKASSHNGFPRWDTLDDLEGDPWDHVEWAYDGPFSAYADRILEDD